MTIVALGVVCGTGLFLYQLRRAETGRPNHLPRVVREFVAAREYRAAKNAEYEDRRLLGYMRVLSLDGDHYPEVWLHICDINVQSRAWAAARITCKRAVDLEGPTASNQTTLGEVYEALRDYPMAAEAYANAARLDPRDPMPQRRALWTFLEAGRYDIAIAAGSDLVANNATGPSSEDGMKAHTMLGFAYTQLGNRLQARAEYAVGLPDWRDPSCSMQQHFDAQQVLICSGVSRKSGLKVSLCIGAGCK